MDEVRAIDIVNLLGGSGWETKQDRISVFVRQIICLYVNILFMPTAMLPDRSLPHLPVRARTLGFLLRELYGLLQERVYRAVAAAGHPGLRAVHSPVLRHLPPEGARVADLARATGLAKQSVTYVVEDLVLLGYLRAEPDPKDGRARRLSYTARGLGLLDTLLRASEATEDALAAALGQERLRSLRDTLELALRSPPPHERAKGPAGSPSATRRRGRMPARGRS